jgi:hypothetical protein
MVRLALIKFLDENGGEMPDNSLPGFGYTGNRPSNELPKPPGSIGTLPVFPFDPTEPVIDNELPGGGTHPSNPIQLHPGLKLVVKYVACVGLVAVPLPSPTPEPK